MKHPIQNTHVDKGGVLRFVQNDVVQLMLKLLKTKQIGLNELHDLGSDISSEDWDQFNQLIGYSVSGAPIDDAIIEAAYLKHKNGLSVEEARAQRAEQLLADVRQKIREGIADLYGIHPDNLQEEDEI